MANKGYHSYRGRRKGGRSLLTILLVLMLLAAVGATVAMRHVTYSDDGSIYLDLPFFRPEQSNSTDTDLEEGDMHLVIDKPQKEEQPEQQPQPEPHLPMADHRLAGLAALPTDMTLLESTLAQSGANGFVYPARDNTGLVRYRSLGALSSAVAQDAVGRDLLETLCGQEDILSVARLNAFHDSYYAWVNMEEAAICQSGGYIWYDNHSYHWLDPDKEQTRRYVISLAVECAEMGFDEILLEEMCYPSTGSLYKIDYSRNTMEKAEALELFLTELRQALEPYGTKVSLLLDERLLHPEENEEYIRHSGQDLKVLLPLVDMVYMATEDTAAAAESLIRQAGEDAPSLVVISSDENPPAEQWYRP